MASFDDSDERESGPFLRLGQALGLAGGAVCDTTDAISVNAWAMLSSTGAGLDVANDVDERLKAATVVVSGSAPQAGYLVTTLNELGLTVEQRPLETLTDAADLVLVCATTHEIDQVASWNSRAIELDQPWLPIQPFDGSRSVVGPLIVPPATPCLECYVRRRAANSAYANQYDGIYWDPTPKPQPTTMFDYLAMFFGLTVTLRWLGLRDQSLPGRVLTIDAGELEARRARVFKVPRCSACSPLRNRSSPYPWS